MPESVERTSCASHPDRAAAGICAGCGKPVCEPCSIQFVSTEQTFCSERCRDALPEVPGQAPVSNATLEAGLDKPIRLGWALAARSTGAVAKHVLPIALLAGLIVGLVGRSGPTSPGEDAALAVLPLLLLIFAPFGIALVGVILSDRHTGLVEGAALAATARRFVPWVVTWIMMLGIILAGYVALILPGIYLGLRFFWADEFALVHGKGPVAALRASWELTRGRAGAVFMFQFILGMAQYLVLIPVVVLGAILLVGLEAIGMSDAEALTGAEAFALFFAGFVVYGMMHGPEIVQFYGMRAAQAKLAAAAASETRAGGGIFAVAAALGAVVGIGLLGAIVVPNLLNAVDRGKQKRTYADSREIAVAMESFAETNGQYPQAENLEQAESRLAPAHIGIFPKTDGWGHPFRIVSTPTGYEIRSAGKDGVFETHPPRGVRFGFDSDIVWRNGELVQWPETLGFE